MSGWRMPDSNLYPKALIPPLPSSPDPYRKSHKFFCRLICIYIFLLYQRIRLECLLSIEALALYLRLLIRNSIYMSVKVNFYGVIHMYEFAVYLDQLFSLVFVL
jgi:hypothetical protein